MLETVFEVILTGDRKMAAGYAVFFVFAVVMPGWRSLAGVGVVLGMLIVSGLVYLNKLDAPGGAGVAHAIAFGIVFFSGLGLLTGVLTRALSLFLREFAVSRGVRIAVTVVGFLFIPSLTVVSASAREWSYRMPSESCLQSIITVQVVGQAYDLPAAPMFTIYMSDDNRVYDFRANAHQRAVCALARDSVEPLRVTALRMRIDSLENASKPRVEAFCRTPSNVWAKALCGSDADAETPPNTSKGYPMEVALFSPDEISRRYYGYRHTIGIGVGSHARFVQEQTEARMEGTPLDSERAGIFDRYSNGYWVAHSRLWTTDGGDPFTFKCYEIGTPETLHCTTTYELNEEIAVTWRFHAPMSDFETTARAVNRNLLAVVSELSTAK